MPYTHPRPDFNWAEAFPIDLNICARGLKLGQLIEDDEYIILLNFRIFRSYCL